MKRREESRVMRVSFFGPLTQALREYEKMESLGRCVSVESHSRRDAGLKVLNEQGVVVEMRRVVGWML